jgi:hypothetical protein
MTIDDPGVTPPNPPRTISAGPLLGGLLLSLGLGAILNIFAGVIGAAAGYKVAAGIIGAVPGLLFMAWSRVARANGFAHGLFIGGCIVALIGGACGAALVGLSVH